MAKKHANEFHIDEALVHHLIASKRQNDRHGCWSSHPLHNFASHGADAFRMLAVGIGKLANKGLSAESGEGYDSNTSFREWLAIAFL